MLFALIAYALISTPNDGWWVANVGGAPGWNYVSDVEAMPEKRFSSNIAVRGPDNREWAVLKAPSRTEILEAVAKAKKEAGRYPGATEALDEVNAKRATMGLRPFIRDDKLTEGAAKICVYLAAKLSANHTSNDFAFLPPGSSASAGGLGAGTPDWGWISCCYRENWKYAGAAWAWGRDGKRYNYIFVR